MNDNCDLQMIDEETFVAAVRSFAELAQAKELLRLASFLQTTYIKTQDSSRDSPASLDEGDRTDVL